MNYFKTGILLVLVIWVIFSIGIFIGGGRGSVIAFVLALIIDAVIYWFCGRMVLSMYKAYEIPEEKYYHLYSLVSELAGKARLPVPRLFMIESQAPNLFTVGRDSRHASICVTKGLLTLLEENELKGALSHELMHIKNNDMLLMTVAGVIAHAVMMIANIGRLGKLFNKKSGKRDNSRNVFGKILLSIVAPIAAVIVQLLIWRSREYNADKEGSYIARDKEYLIKALSKIKADPKLRELGSTPQTAHLFIINPSKRGFISGLFSTHPPVEERIKRLQTIKI